MYRPARSEKVIGVTILGARVVLVLREGQELQSTQRKFLPVVTGYVIAILTGLALPVAAVVIYFGLAVYLVVPFREASRLLFRRS